MKNCFFFYCFRGRPVFDFLKVLICIPEVPEKMAAPMGGRASSAFISDREVSYCSNKL